MQNEILQIMALQILRELAASIQSTEFTIMVDETTDVTITEQVVIVLCWVDQSLEVHEDFFGLYASIIKDVLFKVKFAT